MATADWYFDFISPYSYFSLGRLDSLAPGLVVRYRPMLLGGLLQHWGQKAPAELPTKRLWTYRHCVWLAAREGLPLTFPASHPFSSLPYLRLCAAAGNTVPAIQRIFQALWTTGIDPADPAVIEGLCQELHVDPQQLASQTVKDSVRRATETAITAGVFGAPTLIIDGQLFWGYEGLDLAQAYLSDPGVLGTPAMVRVGQLPVGLRPRTV